MIRTLVLAVALLAAAPVSAAETLAVVAIADPPAGPGADLAEHAHQLRTACRDRVGGVAEVSAMRARLLGQRSSATVTELDRAYGGALAVYQNGEFEGAIRTLRAIVEDLEGLPESHEAYSQWVRAQLRLAHAALTIGREKEADEAMSAVARTEPTLQPEPDQYSPTYRRRFEQAKARIRALPTRKLQVSAEGFQGTVFVNGRAMGTTPLTLTLPAGVYRVGGASGALHVPSFRVDLHEDRAVVLDFALAEALRVHAGPGLAVPAARRGEAIVRAGAWLGVDRIVAVSGVTEGDAQFLLGSIYDVRNGALMREGSVRTMAGTVPAANVGALAAFLLTGQSSREVVDRTERARIAPALATEIRRAAGEDARGAEKKPAPAEARPARATAELATTPRQFAPLALPHAERAEAAAPDRTRRGWIRPAAYGSAFLFGVFTGVAVHQGLAARQASSDAAALVGPGGALAPGADPSRYRDLRDESRAASRNAYVSGGAAVVFAVTAGVLGWKSRTPREDAAPTLALRF